VLFSVQQCCKKYATGRAVKAWRPPVLDSGFLPQENRKKHGGKKTGKITNVPLCSLTDETNLFD
jgi:hypothetical protein